MSYDDLVKVKGINSAKAASILAAIELIKRALEVKEDNRPIIKSVDDVVAQAVYLRDKTR